MEKKPAREETLVQIVKHCFVELDERLVKAENSPLSEETQAEARRLRIRIGKLISRIDKAFQQGSEERKMALLLRIMQPVSQGIEDTMRFVEGAPKCARTKRRT